MEVIEFLFMAMFVLLGLFVGLRWQRLRMEPELERLYDQRREQREAYEALLDERDELLAENARLLGGQEAIQ